MYRKKCTKFFDVPIFVEQEGTVMKSQTNLSGDRKKFYGAVVVHPTCYDGCVELASMQLGLYVMGSTAVQTTYQCCKEIVKTHLLEEGP